MTEKTSISKEEEKCMKGKGFSPDWVIMKLLTEKINCSLPWSTYKVEGMNDCKTEIEFERYLATILKLQRKIEKIPKKCTYKTWTPFPYSESSTDSKDPWVVIELVMINSKVRNIRLSKQHYPLYFLESYQGGGRVHVLVRLLYWYLWRLFGPFPWRKHPWHFRIL